MRAACVEARVAGRGRAPLEGRKSAPLPRSWLTEPLPPAPAQPVCCPNKSIVADLLVTASKLTASAPITAAQPL